jgi:hypothetical protein
VQRDRQQGSHLLIKLVRIDNSFDNFAHHSSLIDQYGNRQCLAGSELSLCCLGSQCYRLIHFQLSNEAAHFTNVLRWIRDANDP